MKVRQIMKRVFIYSLLIVAFSSGVVCQNEKMEHRMIGERVLLSKMADRPVIEIESNTGIESNSLEGVEVQQFNTTNALTKLTHQFRNRWSYLFQVFYQQKDYEGGDLYNNYQGMVNFDITYRVLANMNITCGVSGEKKEFDVLKEQNFNGLGFYTLGQWSLMPWSVEVYGKLLDKYAEVDSDGFDYETEVSISRYIINKDYQITIKGVNDSYNYLNAGSVKRMVGVKFRGRL